MGGIKRRFWELGGVFGVPAAYRPQILGIILPKTRNKCLFSEMLCARSFKNHTFVASKITHFSPSRASLSRRHPSRTLSGAPHASLILPPRALLRGFPEQLSEASQSSPRISLIRCAAPVSGGCQWRKRAVFEVRFQRRRTDCQGRAWRARGKSPGSRRHPSRTLSEAPQTPLILHLATQSASETLLRAFSEVFRSGPQRLLRVPSIFPSSIVPQRFQGDTRGEKGRFLCGFRGAGQTARGVPGV